MVMSRPSHWDHPSHWDQAGTTQATGTKPLGLARATGQADGHVSPKPLEASGAGLQVRQVLLYIRGYYCYATGAMIAMHQGLLLLLLLCIRGYHCYASGAIIAIIAMHQGLSLLLLLCIRG